MVVDTTANMLDYLAWRGDLTFAADGFNEVDNLIFSELAYVNMDGLAPESFGERISVRELCARYIAAGRDQSYLVNDPSHALKAAAGTKRFGEAELCGYVNEVDVERQMQFSAVTFLPGDGSVFVAFRGTDNTIVGWREDFNMNFLPETPGQAEAAAYLRRALDEFRLPTRVGGHSKGGNFAVYAAAFCKSGNGEIVAVYSNDGPGLNRETARTPEYLAVVPKITKIVPDQSLVGLLLAGCETPKAVKSDAKGIMQHNPYTWQISGNSFVPAEATGETIADETVRRWSESLDGEQWKNFSQALFDALEASGATTLYELNSAKATYYTAVARALYKTDRAVYHGFLDAAKKLLRSGVDTLETRGRRKKN